MTDSLDGGVEEIGGGEEGGVGCAEDAGEEEEKGGGAAEGEEGEVVVEEYAEADEDEEPHESEEEDEERDLDVSVVGFVVHCGERVAEEGAEEEGDGGGGRMDYNMKTSWCGDEGISGKGFVGEGR